MDLVQGITEDKRAVKVAALLDKFFKEHGVTDFAGNMCYSPEAWEARGELYGTKSLLVVTYDGGDHSHYFNLDYGSVKMFEALTEFLSKNGLYFEPCTSWYAAIYHS